MMTVILDAYRLINEARASRVATAAAYNILLPGTRTAIRYAAQDGQQAHLPCIVVESCHDRVLVTVAGPDGDYWRTVKRTQLG